MSFRGTAILIAILAVLGAGVYFLDYRPNPNPSGLDPKLQIWNLDKDTVQRVVARSPEGEETMEKRSDGLWYLLPQDVRADYWRITGTLVRLSNMRGSRRLNDNNTDWAPYGLDDPQTALTLRDGAGVDHTLLIGGKSPTEDGYYARQPDDNTLWLIGSFNVEDVQRFVKEPAFEPTPAPSPEPTAAATPTPGPTSTAEPAAAATPVPPGLPTVGVSAPTTP
ncbi:MAG TPA: DUF4340 domain-containing protein [Chloroflexota bacterium]|nr:DUF4340 domain-containing protein [Chloroflexota bacterium]